jgi:hypothetical protein
MDNLEELKFYLKYFEEFLNNENENININDIDEYLKRAECLNDSIENDFQKDSKLIRDKDIFDLINQNQLKTNEELDNLLHLNEKYILKQEMVSVDYRNIMLNDMIGFNELKIYLDSINFNNENINNFSFMVYGLFGSGKTTFLILYLLKKKLLSFDSVNNINNLVYLIDFKTCDKNFEKIQNSINNLLNRDQTKKSILLLKNCESLFEEEFDLKTIGDLIYELNDVNEKCLYILISSKPWLIHSSLVNCFRKKFCIQSSNLNELNKLFFKIIEKKSSNIWVLKEEFENFLKSSNLFQSTLSNDSKITAKIVNNLANSVFDLTKNFIMDIFKVKLKENNLDFSDFDSFTSKTVPFINKWQFLNRRYSIVRALNTTHNTSRRESKISAVTRNSISSSIMNTNNNNNDNGQLFVLIKSNIWQEFSNELKEILNKNLSEIINEIPALNDDYYRIDKFKNNLQ